VLPLLLLPLLLLLTVVELLLRRRRRRQEPVLLLLVLLVVVVGGLLLRRRRRSRVLVILPLRELLLLLLLLLVEALPSAPPSRLGGSDHQARLGRRGAVALPRRRVRESCVHRGELPRVHQAPIRGALAPPAAGSRPGGRLCRVPGGDTLAQVRRRPGADLRKMRDELVRARVLDHDRAQEALRRPPARRDLGLADRAKVLPGPVAGPAAEAAVDELLVAAVLELVELVVVLLIVLKLVIARRRRRRRLHDQALVALCCAASRVGRVGDFLQGRGDVPSHRNSRGEKEARAAG
jgi:hypothetical protein